MIFSIESKDPSLPALKAEDGTVITYGQLCAVASETARAAGSRCLVFCLCRNVPGSVCGYVGFLSRGVVPLLLDAAIDPGLLDSLRQVYRPSYFWAPEDMEAGLPGTEKVYGALGYALLKTGDGPCELYPELALLLTTSGSTGSPKLVRQSRENVEANARSIGEYLGLTRDERPITTLPMNYTYGLSIINSHLLAGACVLLTTCSIVQRGFWDFFKREGATSFGGVPYTYEILKKLKFFTLDLPSLKSMTQAGGKLSVTLQQEFGVWARERGVRFFVMYGQAEATARMSYLPPERCLEKPGSMGIAIPGGRFSLIDADGSLIEDPDVSGELLYEGPNVTLGYASTPADLALGDERQGVLHTGDIAKRDAEGYYYIVGRKKRFIKLYGVRVGLDECEQLLRDKFPGCDFACVGQDGLMRIFTTDKSRAGAAADYLSGTLRLNFAAFEELYIEKLPRNDAGKIAYRLLEERQ